MERKTQALGELLRIVEALRAPGGCPWDQKQTLRDVSRYLLEESCEVQDALALSEGSGTQHVCEELGDVLMNIFLASVIAEEGGAFSLTDVADGIREKLIRRHPHVFGDVVVSNADEVLVHWNAIKDEERREKGEDLPRSRLDGVPRSLPPLAAAHELTRKAAKCGFDWDEPLAVVKKLEEEIDELRELLPERDEALAAERVEEELGDILFSAVNLCRKLGHRPDDALRRTMRKFESRFREIEQRVGDIDSASLEEMDAVWNEIKAKEE